MDYEIEIREAVFKHRNEINQALAKYEDDMDDRAFVAVMLSGVLNGFEDALCVISRQIKELGPSDPDE